MAEGEAATESGSDGHWIEMEEEKEGEGGRKTKWRNSTNCFWRQNLKTAISETCIKNIKN